MVAEQALAAIGFVGPLLLLLLAGPPLAKRLAGEQGPTSADALLTLATLLLLVVGRSLMSVAANEVDLVIGGALLIALARLRGPAGLLIAWLLATAGWAAIGQGIDLEALRAEPAPLAPGGYANLALTVAFGACAGLGVLARPGLSADGARSSGPLLLIALALAIGGSLTDQTTVSAVAVPASALLLAIHLQLLDPPLIALDRCGLPALTFLLIATTLAFRFSDHTRWGALASPLLWSVPALSGMLDRAGRRAATATATMAASAAALLGALLSCVPGYEPAGLVLGALACGGLISARPRVA